MIEFNCPMCSRPLVVQDDKQGKRGKCIDCKHDLTVPRRDDSRVKFNVTFQELPGPTPEHHEPRISRSQTAVAVVGAILVGLIICVGAYESSVQSAQVRQDPDKLVVAPKVAGEPAALPVTFNVLEQEMNRIYGFQFKTQGSDGKVFGRLALDKMSYLELKVRADGKVSSGYLGFDSEIFADNVDKIMLAYDAAIKASFSDQQDRITATNWFELAKQWIVTEVRVRQAHKGEQFPVSTLTTKIGNVELTFGCSGLGIITLGFAAK